MNPKSLSKNHHKHLIANTQFPPKWAGEWGEDNYGLFADFVFHQHCINSKAVSQRFRWIAPGEFLMGSPEVEKQRWDENEELHQVSLTQGYWLADTSVTQRLWRLVMSENPSRFKGDTKPVETISWNTIQNFLININKMYETTLEQIIMRLPSEAEWEHACRAGTTTPFSFGSQLTPELVNYNGGEPYADGENGIYREETVSVKSLPINPWGLYEMHGNVWEWCVDAWQAQVGKDTVSDIINEEENNSDRVIRGGAWNGVGWHIRSAFRYHYSPSERAGNLGFRLLLGQELQPKRK